MKVLCTKQIIRFLLLKYHELAISFVLLGSSPFPLQKNFLFDFSFLTLQSSCLYHFPFKFLFFPSHEICLDIFFISPSFFSFHSLCYLQNLFVFSICQKTFFWQWQSTGNIGPIHVMILGCLAPFLFSYNLNCSSMRSRVLVSIDHFFSIPGWTAMSIWAFPSALRKACSPVWISYQHSATVAAKILCQMGSLLDADQIILCLVTYTAYFYI